MRYWLDLFTGTTWQEFRDAGATVSGFSERRRKLASQIQTGDILLCYLTGVMRWIGALEVVGPSEGSARDTCKNLSLQCATGLWRIRLTMSPTTPRPIGAPIL
jgi:hypothetical protein